jgi:eukaryotic-like serine/threonine-protein kinase
MDVEITADQERVLRVWRFASVEFDEGRRQLKIAGEPVELEPRPLELLHLFLRHAGEVVTKDEIFEAVWPGRVVTDASLTKCVARLRQSLGDTEQTLIQTVHGYGYRLAAAVSVQSRPAEPHLAGTARNLRPGEVIPERANWKLVRRLGAGGFGDAWLGEHCKTGEKRVFKFGLDGDQLTGLKREITLFRLLNTGLESPRDFARILDWNLEAPPYFIEVEWVAGGNLQEWVTERMHSGALPLADRLELVAQISDALAAAHSMGVLHKDLKPTNVLVDPDAAGRPRIKLCDFGSGAALDLERLNALGITRLGFTRAADPEDRTSGTPLYLAPELMAGRMPSLRSDIYALGVILFQMVVGDFRRPLAPGWEQDVDDELLREDIAWAAAGDPLRRLADAAQLASRLRDLERRRAERANRQLAQAEAEHIQRALERAQARRGLWKALVATLLVALAVTMWLGISAQRARQDAIKHSMQAQAVTGFLINDILAAANPNIAGTHDARLLPLLDAASTKLEQRFASQPVVLAELQSAMGQGYAALFETEKAEKLLIAAEKGLTQTLGNVDPETQNARMALWYLYTANVDIAKVYQVSQRIAAAETLAGRPHSSMSYKAQMMLAWIPCVAKAPQVMGLSNCGDVVRPFYIQSLQHFGPDDLTTPEMAWYWGVALMYSSREDMAEPVLREACAGLERYYAAANYRLAECRRYLAWALDANGKPEAAAPLLGEVAKDYEKTLGNSGQFTAIANRDLARTLLHLGDFAQAAEIARRAVEAMAGQDNRDLPELLKGQQVLSDALVQSGQSSAGLSIADDALKTAVTNFGPADPLTASLRNTLAEARLRTGSPTQAEALMRDNLALGRDLPNRPDWYVGEMEASLARVLVAEHLAQEARPLLEDAVQLLRRGLGPDNRRTRAAAATLAQLR